ncbi:MAG: transposase [Bacteroidetes bacterium]|jgi:transposase-like protein|nr:transposase [Bacteroidota bacterium]
MENQTKSVKRYSVSFQHRVVKEFEEEGISISVIKRRYDIKGSETIQKWIRKFGKTHLLNQIIRIETMEEKDRIKKLEEEIKRLKLALADSVLAKDCLEVVIDEANKEYKTDLKKNFGSERSKNLKHDTK